jgi:mannosyltransferase OCH1-like enzyme
MYSWNFVTEWVAEVTSIEFVFVVSDEIFLHTTDILYSVQEDQTPEKKRELKCYACTYILCVHIDTLIHQTYNHIFPSLWLFAWNLYKIQPFSWNFLEVRI